MPSRFEYERAVRASGLPSLSRLLALTVATWADVRTGAIPSRLQPSLTVLEEATGMSRAAVRKHLDVLESGHWLVRNRPTPAAARARKARTQYRLTIPDGFAVSDSNESELGHEMPQPGVRDAPEDPALGHEVPQARAPRAPELGHEEAPARAPGAPKSSFSSGSTPTDQGEGARRERPLTPITSPARRPAGRPSPGDNQLAPIDNPETGFTGPSDTMRAWAIRTFGSGLDIEHETALFLDHHRAQHTRRPNWPAEWQKWMRRSAKWASERANRPPLRAVSGGYQPFRNPTDDSVWDEPL